MSNAPGVLKKNKLMETLLEKGGVLVKKLKDWYDTKGKQYVQKAKDFINDKIIANIKKGWQWIKENVPELLTLGLDVFLELWNGPEEGDAPPTPGKIEYMKVIKEVASIGETISNKSMNEEKKEDKLHQNVQNLKEILTKQDDKKENKPQSNTQNKQQNNTQNNTQKNTNKQNTNQQKSNKNTNGFPTSVAEATKHIGKLLKSNVHFGNEIRFENNEDYIIYYHKLKTYQKNALEEEIEKIYKQIPSDNKIKKYIELLMNYIKAENQKNKKEKQKYLTEIVDHLNATNILLDIYLFIYTSEKKKEDLWPDLSWTMIKIHDSKMIPNVLIDGKYVTKIVLPIFTPDTIQKALKYMKKLIYESFLYSTILFKIYNSLNNLIYCIDQNKNYEEWKSKTYMCMKKLDVFFYVKEE